MEWRWGKGKKNEWRSHREGNINQILLVFMLNWMWPKCKDDECSDLCESLKRRPQNDCRHFPGS